MWENNKRLEKEKSYKVVIWRFTPIGLEKNTNECNTIDM